MRMLLTVSVKSTVTHSTEAGGVAKLRLGWPGLLESHSLLAMSHRLL